MFVDHIVKGNHENIVDASESINIYYNNQPKSELMPP